MSAASPLLRQRRPVRRRRIHKVPRALKLLLRVGLVMALPALAAWWLFFSGDFDLVEVASEGSARVDADWVRSALSEEMGGNLLLLPLSRIEDRVRGHAWPEQVRTTKDLPSTLRIEVTDRSVAAILEADRREFFLDERGRRIEEIGSGRGTFEPSLLRLRFEEPRAVVPSGLSEADLVHGALEFEAHLSDSLPEWRSDLERMEILGAGGYRLHFSRMGFPVVLEQDDLVAGMGSFVLLAPEISRRFPDIEEVDLRVEGRIVVRPTVIHSTVIHSEVVDVEDTTAI